MPDLELTWLACPCCGSPVETESTITEEVVRCQLCPLKMVYKGSQSAMNAMWNSRAKKLEEAVKTSGNTGSKAEAQICHCEHRNYWVDFQDCNCSLNINFCPNCGKLLTT